MDSIYPPFAGNHFTSFPILAAGKEMTFEVHFSPRYDPRGKTNKEIVWFLPGYRNESYIFISTSARKFYICVKRNLQEPIACSNGHQLQVTL